MKTIRNTIVALLLLLAAFITQSHEASAFGLLCTDFENRCEIIGGTMVVCEGSEQCWHESWHIFVGCYAHYGGPDPIEDYCDVDEYCEVGCVPGEPCPAE